MLVLLLLDLEHLGGQGGAGVLDSEGQGRLLVGLGEAVGGGLEFRLLAAIIVAAKTAFVGLSGGSVFNFNLLSVVDDSVVGSFQNNDIISSSKKNCN